MVVNLQFFGGRGGASGLNTIRQITVDMDGIKVTYRSEKGKTWRIENGNNVKDTVPMTLKEIEDRAKKAGYSVKTYTNKEYAQYEKEYRKDREETSKQLDRLWYEAGPRPRKGWRGH